jgi:hypothetical protein
VQQLALRVGAGVHRALVARLPEVVAVALDALVVAEERAVVQRTCGPNACLALGTGAAGRLPRSQRAQRQSSKEAAAKLVKRGATDLRWVQAEGVAVVARVVAVWGRAAGSRGTGCPAPGRRRGRPSCTAWRSTCDATGWLQRAERTRQAVLGSTGGAGIGAVIHVAPAWAAHPYFLDVNMGSLVV